jgi:Ca-activated chloride channel family protein
MRESEAYSCGIVAAPPFCLHRIIAMKYFNFCRLFSAVAILFALMLGAAGDPNVFAQARRQPPAPNQKKNKRPDEEKKEEPPPQDTVNKQQEAEKLTIATNLVNVDAVVYQKKGGQIVTGLRKGNFAIFVDGVQQQITNFATPEAPITIVMVIEYSKWTEIFGLYGSGGMEPGTFEVIRPAAMFLSRFIKPPDDYASVVAFDMRPTPLTDFTNNPARINEVINLLLRNRPAFRENNLFDALKFVLVGGRGDSVVLEDSKSEKSDYAGLVNVQGRRRAVILIASGWDTFSKINYGQARKILQNAGIPIYIIGTAGLYKAKYGDNLPATGGINGSPGRMDFLQAENELKTFSSETGGAYYPYTFEGEIPSILQNINAMLRSQYSLGFKPPDVHDGKSHKIVVKVDVDGDGTYDDKQYVVQAREFYNAPKADGKQ